MEPPNSPGHGSNPTAEPWRPPAGRRKRPGHREQQARNARFFGGRRKWVWIGVLAAVAVAVGTFAVAGFAQSDFRKIATGDCGYFTRAPGHRDTFERRPCDHPEAVLIVTQAASKQECAVGDAAFGKSGRRKSWCLQLNVAVGECVNDPKNKNAWLNRLRKVPCSAGTFMVDTRVAAEDRQVCAASSKKFAVTEAVVHVRPPVSYCLHQI